MTYPDLDAATLSYAVGDEELLRALVDSSESGICVLNRARRIIFWNEAAQRITGYLGQEVAGRLCQDDLFMDCDASGEVLCDSGCPLGEVFADGRRREYRIFLRHHNGHRIPVRVRAYAVRSDSGETAGAIALFEKSAPALHAGSGEPEPILDELTGAANHEYGEMEAEHALRLMRRFGTPVGWIGLELENIEALDHQFGRGFIEAAITIAAHTLNANLGPRDLAIRWRDAGFRILVRNAMESELREYARTLSALVKASTVEWWGEARSVSAATASVVAHETDSLESLECRVLAALQERQSSVSNLIELKSSASSRTTS